eukprot:1092705-Lingulodinium_polyedra.AAC.2
MKGPEVPTKAQQAVLKEHLGTIPGQITGGHCPPWLRDVCRYRNAFDGAVLTYESPNAGEGTVWLSFLYACQQPFYA